MGVREQINQKPWIAVVGGLIAVAAVVGFLYIPGRSTVAEADQALQSFITVDDGKTFALSSSNESPPFLVDGKTACRAHVYTCDGGKSKFVGYLERYTPKGKELVKQIQDQQRAHASPPQLMLQTLNEIEIKRPGDARWVAQSDANEAARIIDVRCPNNPAVHADPVNP